RSRPTAVRSPSRARARACSSPTPTAPARRSRCGAAPRRALTGARPRRRSGHHRCLSAVAAQRPRLLAPSESAIAAAVARRLVACAARAGRLARRAFAAARARTAAVVLVLTEQLDHALLLGAVVLGVGECARRIVVRDVAAGERRHLLEIGVEA